MNNIFQGFEFICAYIENIYFYKSLLELTSKNIKESGLKYNSEKSFFGQTKMKYLCFWATHDGVRPLD